MSTIIKQGQDYKAQVLVVDDQGAAIAVDSTVAGKVQLQTRIGSKVYKTYSTDPADNLPAIEVDDTTTNQLNLNLTSEETRAMAGGDLYADVVVFFTDADFADGTRSEHYSFKIGTIVQNPAKNLG